MIDVPIYRVHKTANYTIMSNYHLRDPRLTLKAKGLLSLMLSLPPEWKHSISGFTAICKEGRRSISSAFSELEECGYIVRERVNPKKGNGRIDYVYNIYELPQEVSDDSDSSTFCAAENSTQFNIDNKGALSKSFSGEGGG